MVQANPQERKNVVLYIANNLARFFGGIKAEAMVYDDAIIKTSAVPIKKLPANINGKFMETAVIIIASMPIDVPRIKATACPNFLLNNPAKNPIIIFAIERVFAIKLSRILSTAKPDSKVKNCE